MNKFRLRRPRGTLGRFTLLRLLGGLWMCLFAWVLVTWTAEFRQLARHQDERLLARLAIIAEAMPGATSEAGVWRLSSSEGQWLAGDALMTVPARPVGGTVSLQLVDRAGTLMRTAAMWRHGQGQGPEQALVQVAEPWSARLPAMERVFTATTWMAVAMTVTMSVLVAITARATGRWLNEAERALMYPDRSPEYTGPDELRAAVMAVRELHAAQRRWVDDQRRFLADASHQLRTPMAVLRAQLQSAIAGDVLASDVLPQMLHTVDRAAAMANNLLSLSKLEQLKRTGALSPVDLEQITRDAVVELAPLIAAKRLDFALEGSAHKVSGDAVMLGELLRNLLANAIHHTPPGGSMGALLRAFAGHVELVIWDSGPGLDDDVHQRLFQPFSAAKGGVGLGLSICRQIAEAMNAKIYLYNRMATQRVVGVDAIVSWQQAP